MTKQPEALRLRSWSNRAALSFATHHSATGVLDMPILQYFSKYIYNILVLVHVYTQILFQQLLYWVDLKIERVKGYWV